uniref:Cyclic nucleotide-binding domain-containing protein n=1 Tax=Vannella robusta TaxID=1487602 RepID=A0A7S4M3F8_9EUKA|mmetsp:Transcript_1030/g.1274  ORF Transcript_1030/g.1274 Transcript_1030/m.1274 type:complete len:102 (+) Transcript_1030:347-652(+)
MYQVVQGSCQVREAGDSSNVIAELQTGEIFGEISLLLGASTATIITASEKSEEKQNTIVLVIEAEFLQRLFSNDKTLAGKFYKYVAIVTQRRLLDRSSVNK